MYSIRLVIVYLDPVDCPKGGKVYNGYCYVIPAIKAAWAVAQTHCETEYGGILANITEELVHNHITNMLTSSSTRWVHHQKI